MFVENVAYTDLIIYRTWVFLSYHVVWAQYWRIRSYLWLLRYQIKFDRHFPSEEQFMVQYLAQGSNDQPYIINSHPALLSSVKDKVWICRGEWTTVTVQLMIDSFLTLRHDSFLLRTGQTNHSLRGLSLGLPWNSKLNTHHKFPHLL